MINPIIGGIMFGSIIGYLAWYAVLPGEREVDLKTVSIFISIVAGAAITSLFPAGSDIFGGYCFGLAIGFFITPVKNNFVNFSNYLFEKIDERARKHQSQQNKIVREINSALKEERDLIIGNWSEIDGFISAQLLHTKKLTDQNLHSALSPYSEEGIKYIAGTYVRKHPEYRVHRLSRGFYIYNLREERISIKANWANIESFIENIISYNKSITESDLIPQNYSADGMHFILKEYARLNPNKVKYSTNNNKTILLRIS